MVRIKRRMLVLLIVWTLNVVSESLEDVTTQNSPVQTIVDQVNLTSINYRNLYGHTSKYQSYQRKDLFRIVKRSLEFSNEHVSQETTPHHSRKKRMHVCSFYTRIGFPLGGCLYFYVRQPSALKKHTHYNKITTTARPEKSRTKPTRPIDLDYMPGNIKGYKLRWPSLFLLGGSLGK